MRRVAASTLRHWRSLYFALLALTPTVDGWAAPLPLSFNAVYAVKKGPITIGETRRSLSRDSKGRFVFESVTRPTGISKLLTSGQVVERSVWTEQGSRPRPVEYTYFNSGKNRRTVHLDFDWEQRQVTNTINGSPWQMSLLDDGTLDKLLFQLRMMQDLPGAVGELRYPVADGGRLKTYRLEILGPAAIRIPLGTYDTIVVRHKLGNITTTYWCAKPLDYFPVRIEKRMLGEGVVSAALTAIHGLGQ